MPSFFVLLAKPSTSPGGPNGEWKPPNHVSRLVPKRKTGSDRIDTLVQVVILEDRVRVGPGPTEIGELATPSNFKISNRTNQARLLPRFPLRVSSPPMYLLSSSLGAIHNDLWAVHRTVPRYRGRVGNAFVCKSTFFFPFPINKSWHARDANTVTSSSGTTKGPK